MLEPKGEAGCSRNPTFNGWFTKTTMGAPFSTKHMGFPCQACHSDWGRGRGKLFLGAGARVKFLVAVHLFQL